MTTFTIQYLENSYPEADPNNARKRLRQAFERLPISTVLLGWELPPRFEEAIAEETLRQNAQLFRWQPILTGDAHTDLPTEWLTRGPEGDLLHGYAGLPEFTFICPNHSAVIEFLFERVESAAASGLFQGLFLDRIRFPSPSRDPLHHLACFCSECTRTAADMGIDLRFIRENLLSLPINSLVDSLFDRPSVTNAPLTSFLDFRSGSITRTVGLIAEQARSHGLSVGLDCFTPALTRMVGQDLSSLDKHADWIKLMLYPRVYGPAGIPYEILGFVNWLESCGISEIVAMQILSLASRLSLPESKIELMNTGFTSKVISDEIRHGYELGISNLLAGIALVKMEKIHDSTPAQIQSDLKASLNANGLVISWDLWLTPLNYLDQINKLWSSS